MASDFVLLAPCTQGDDQRHYVPVGADVASHHRPLQRILLSQLSHGAGCSTLALPRFSSQCLVQDSAGSTRWTWEKKFMSPYPGPAPPPAPGLVFCWEPEGLGGWKLQLSALIHVFPPVLAVCACICQRAALTASSEQLLECGHRSQSVTCMARCVTCWLLGKLGAAAPGQSRQAGPASPQRVRRGACAKYGATQQRGEGGHTQGRGCFSPCSLTSSSPAVLPSFSSFLL